MHNILPMLGSLGRIANNMHHGYKFGVWAGNWTHVGELSWSKCCDHSADTVHSSISIGRVAWEVSPDLLFAKSYWGIGRELCLASKNDLIETTYEIQARTLRFHLGTLSKLLTMCHIKWEILATVCCDTLRDLFKETQKPTLDTTHAYTS